VTSTLGPAQAHRRVIVIGAGGPAQTTATELRAAGVTDVAILPGREVVSSVFDDGTDTWELQTSSGDTSHAAVVIAADQPWCLPWIPELSGRNDFRGASFHAAQWDREFDPAGMHIAVIGTDATAGHYIEQLTRQAASVTVFTHPPRRIVQEVPLWTTRAKRWLRRHTRVATRDEQPRPALVGSAIEALTPSGIRTRDGVEHRADAIIYGTGFATPDSRLVGAGGLTIQQVWADGMQPFLGIAVHGFPNYFFITGPDIAAQSRYVVECIGLMKDTASTRIEVRHSSQQVFNERAHLNPAQPFRVASAFDLSATPAEDDETYDGAAMLTIGDACHPVRVRLTGHLDPIDGNYHWQGTVFSSLADRLPDEGLKQGRAATLTVGNCSAPARIVEQTPWGTHSIAGVGAPPYALKGT
jgi:cation diffusion facilitator CzcD-associated flavoprotein CzcO